MQCIVVKNCKTNFQGAPPTVQEEILHSNSNLRTCTGAYIMVDIFDYYVKASLIINLSQKTLQIMIEP